MIRGFYLKTIGIFSTLICTSLFANEYENTVFIAGHKSLQHWLLPEMPEPDDNKINPTRVKLGKKLFFDPRLSGDKNMSCATCHSPLFGWSDGLPTARGNKSMVLGRASPSIVNTGFNNVQMWDGRMPTLEKQAIGPMRAHVEMNMNLAELFKFLKNNVEYATLFKKAYPQLEIGEESLGKAIASFERTIVSKDSPFDKWVRGDSGAMSKNEINGFKVFMDPERGNCSVCHSAPNFTDNGFHNLGLASFGNENPDLGRYTERPLNLMKGAFKTPTIRDITLTAPYFHDGSAATLTEVIKHYETGGIVTSNLSPNFKAAKLTEQEFADLLSFMGALTTQPQNFVLPQLPLEN